MQDQKLTELLPTLAGMPLFRGVAKEELSAVLGCLSARTEEYAEDDIIFRAGEPIRTCGLVLRGTLHIRHDDYRGNRTIIQPLSPGDLFGEALAMSDSAVSLHAAAAATDCTVVFLDTRKMLTGCPSSCRFHQNIIYNLFGILSKKNRRLSTKLGHMAQRTTRGKLLSYLSEQAKEHHSAEFDIPFSRQELADYLCVERSAMSAELGKMRDEGLISFARSHFHLHNGAAEYTQF